MKKIHKTAFLEKNAERLNKNGIVYLQLVEQKGVKGIGKGERFEYTFQMVRLLEECTCFIYFKKIKSWTRGKNMLCKENYWD